MTSHMPSFVGLKLFVVLMTGWSLQVLAQELGHESPLPKAPPAGSAADLEKNVFGGFLDPNHPEAAKESRFSPVVLATATATYQISGQYGQVLRLCRFSEAIAKTEKALKDARRCRLTALINLERFSEAEQLALAEGIWPPKANVADPLQEMTSWRQLGALARAQGDTTLAASVNKKILSMTEGWRSWLISREKANVSAELLASINGVSEMIVRSAISDALWGQGRIAYYRQDVQAYRRLVDELLLSQEGEIDWAFLAIDAAVPLALVGQEEKSIELARKSFLAVKADAGFRDQPEPLTRFGTSAAASAALGDERTHRGHVNGRVRLAWAYALLGRQTEAARVLAAARALADKYVIEPPESSSLIAFVEEAHADLLMRGGKVHEAVPLLRSARNRLIGAAMSERSTTFGRRHLAFDSPQLAVSAKLLAAVSSTASMPIRDPGLAREVVDIAADFSASRADGSARQASRTLREPGPELRAMLAREGILIDQVMDLRGALASAFSEVTKPATQDIAALQSRLAKTLDALRALKAEMVSVTEVGNHEVRTDAWGRVKSLIGQKEAFWQWVMHPNGNTILVISEGGIWLRKLDVPVSVLRQLADDLHQAASLRNVSKVSQLKPYPVKKSNALYEALFLGLAGNLPDTNHWILSPPPLLDRVPWSALASERNGGEGPGQRWLIQRAAVTVVPSLAAWVQLRESEASHGAMAFMGIGSPLNRGAVQTTDLRVRGAVVTATQPPSAVRTFSDQTLSDELSSIARLFPAQSRTVLMGRDATKSKLLALPLQNYKVLFFSTHGYLGGAVSKTIGPSLELTGERGDPTTRFLSAEEVARIKIDANVVFLSACDTSASDGYPDAEGFSGLTSAFLLAGARSVVASLWPIESTATAAFARNAMRAFAEKPEEPFAFALRTATLAAMNDPVLIRRHPAFWSPFVVVGR